MKREKLNYFDEFIKGSNYSVQCIELLNNILKNFNNSDLPDNIIKMHTIEHKADEEKHALTNYLLKDFLPPIEREDIVLLAHKIDNLTDNIEEILINIDIFNVTKLRPEVNALTELLTNCCKSVSNLVSEFKNFKKNPNLEEKIIEINRFEENGDALYSKYMRELYREANAIDILIWTQILNCFEQCFDACEQIADAVENIILKNS